MITRLRLLSALALSLFALCSCGNSTSAIAGPWSAAPCASEQLEDGRLPRPCLVPPVPQKRGLPPAIGGAAQVPAPFTGRGRHQISPARAGGFQPRTVRVLAIRVDFEDESVDSTDTYYNRLLLFLSEYYRDTSDGQILIAPTLTQVYRMPRSMAYYGEDDSLGVRESLLCYDAVQAADPDFDFGQFDQVALFHAGAGQESDVKEDSKEQLWSVFFRQIDFSFYLPRPGAESGIRTADRTAEGDTIYVPSVAIYPETQSQDGYVFSCLGVVCHEMGHALGLPDLYDTTAPPDRVFAESQGIGSWDLMASGTWNANGFVPAEFSAWSKLFLGWIEPRVVRQDGVVQLPAVQRDRRTGVVKIPIGGDEYFLVENRSQDPNGDGRFNFTESDSTTCEFQVTDGDTTLVCLFDFYRDTYSGAEWDRWLPGEGKGSGLLIWHIDESVIADNILFNTVNADATHKGIDLEEADGIQDLDFFAVDALSFGGPNDVFRAGGVDTFGPGTSPNSGGYYGIESGITIDQVSPADSVMTFRVSFGASSGVFPLDTPAPFRSNDVILANMDGDPDNEIVLADRAGNLFVLNGDGTPAWPSDERRIFRSLGTPVGTPLAVDVTGDAIADLLVLADDGRLFGFGGGGTGSGGRSLPVNPDGLLLTSSNPLVGTQLWGADLDGDGRHEFGFGGARSAGTEQSRVELFRYDAGRRQAVSALRASLDGGDGPLPACLVRAQRPDGGEEMGLLAAFRRGSAEAPRGGLQLLRLVPPISEQRATAPLPDTVFCSAPVVGDIDRDGRLESLVTASNGLIYAFELAFGSLGDPQFKLEPGWPRPVLASGNDAISLADVDGNGYTEVLVLETGGVLHVLNYHGESLLSLPETVPSETRYFVEPQLAPLVADLDGEAGPEIVLPLSDGQVRATRRDGTAFGSWNYFGGGARGASPALGRLSVGGSIQLVLALDHLDGGRIDVRPIGVAGSEPPRWGMVRRNAGSEGTHLPGSSEPVRNGEGIRDYFAMPNPAREECRIHYAVGEGVTSSRIEIFDLTGRPLRTLEGTGFAGTDNSVTWDLKDESGATVAPGVYLVRLDVTAPEGGGSRFLRLAVLR